MPRASAMVMLFGKGGHLSTDEYSIVLIRTADDAWHGTAVGRSRIAVEGAPATPMKRVAWTLSRAASRELDEAISRRCPPDRPAGPAAVDTGPPPLGYIGERIDVAMPGRAPVSFDASQGGGGIAALIRPPG